MNGEKKEAVYMVNDALYLHLKETTADGDFAYEVFDKASGTMQDNGTITHGQMERNTIRCPILCAAVLALREMGKKDENISEIALRTLDGVHDAKRAYRRAHRDDPHDHSIRFITSNYDELFRIPNGGRVKIDFPNRSFIAPCEYIDDYHTRISGSVYHICQFAEILEQEGGIVKPEQICLQEQAIWQIAHKDYISIRAAEDGWNYSIYGSEFEAIDTGHLPIKGITAQECRDRILADRGWQYRNITEADCGAVEKCAAKAAGTHEAENGSVLRDLRSKKAGDRTPAKAKTEKEECL